MKQLYTRAKRIGHYTCIDFPYIHIHDHRVVMKVNGVKNKQAFRRIIHRMRNYIISKQVIKEDGDGGF